MGFFSSIGRNRKSRRENSISGSLFSVDNDETGLDKRQAKALKFSQEEREFYESRNLPLPNVVPYGKGNSHEQELEQMGPPIPTIDRDSTGRFPMRRLSPVERGVQSRANRNTSEISEEAALMKEYMASYEPTPRQSEYAAKLGEALASPDPSASPPRRLPSRMGRTVTQARRLLRAAQNGPERNLPSRASFRELSPVNELAAADNGAAVARLPVEAPERLVAVDYFSLQRSAATPAPALLPFHDPGPPPLSPLPAPPPSRFEIRDVTPRPSPGGRAADADSPASWKTVDLIQSRSITPLPAPIAPHSPATAQAEQPLDIERLSLEPRVHHSRAKRPGDAAVLSPRHKSDSAQVATSRIPHLAGTASRPSPDQQRQIDAAHSLVGLAARKEEANSKFPSRIPLYKALNPHAPPNQFQPKIPKPAVLTARHRLESYDPSAPAISTQQTSTPPSSSWLGPRIPFSSPSPTSSPRVSPASLRHVEPPKESPKTPAVPLRSVSSEAIPKQAEDIGDDMLECDHDWEHMYNRPKVVPCQVCCKSHWFKLWRCKVCKMRVCMACLNLAESNGMREAVVIRTEERVGGKNK